MSYNNNIPQSTDRPSDSQSELLANFQALKTYVDRNHVALSNPSGDVDEGKHKFCQFPEQGSAPTTLANEGALYTKVEAATSTTALFFRKESDGSEIQLTGGTGTTTGYTFLGNGMLLQWGTFTAPAGVSGNFTFPIAFSVAPYSITLTIFRGTSTSSSSYDLVLAALTATTFKTNSGFSSSHPFYFMAIGAA